MSSEKLLSRRAAAPSWRDAGELSDFVENAVIGIQQLGVDGTIQWANRTLLELLRLILDAAIADEFLAKLTGLLDEWTTGDPLDPAVQMGLLVDAKAANSARASLAQALAEGAELIYQGKGPEQESFMAPHILLLAPGEAGRNNIAWREEFFAPILCVTVVDGREAAFAAAQDTQFGLSLALFTRDLSAALEAQNQLDVGILHVNSESAGADPHVPFGGAKASGFGPKEQGAAASEFYTHTTTVYLKG